jgi:Restriction endonuclease S subunits
MNLSPFENIPKDWNIVELQTTGEVIYGIQASVANNIEPIGTKIITNKNISLDGQLTLKKQNYFEIRTVSHRKTLLKKGDILFNWRSGSKDHVGKTAYFDLDGEYTHSSFILRIRPNLSIINGKYLYYYLYWLRESKYFIKVHSYAINAKFNKSAVNLLPTILPPPEEQRKIAGVLSLVQDAIAQQEQLITLTTELKKALMHKLFTEGTRGEPQKTTEIGLIPESWDVIPLGNMFQIKHGYAFDGEYFKPEGEFILMTPGHFYEDGGFRDQKDKTKYYTGKIPDGYLLNEGDLLVAMTEQKSGLLGSSAFVPESNKYLHNQRLGLIEKLDESYLYKQFLFHLFNTPHIRSEIARTATGSKVKHTSPIKIRNVSFGLPDIKEQMELAFLLDEINTKIDRLVSKKKVINELFRTLLHQLMTAQIRVDDLNLSVLNLKLQGGDE